MPVIVTGGRNGRRPRSEDPLDLDGLVAELKAKQRESLRLPEISAALNRMTIELPLRLNAAFEEEGRDGRGGAMNFLGRATRRMLAERAAFMDGLRADFSLSDDDLDGMDRQSREITGDLLRVAGRRAENLRKRAHGDGLAAHRDALSAGVRDGRIDPEMARRRLQVAADNARFFMDDAEADRLVRDGERAIMRAGLDRLAEQDPELVMERVGNGAVGDLVELDILRAGDVADIKSAAEGEMARRAARAAAGAGAEGALAAAVEVGLPAVREAERTISAEMRAALEAGDEAAYDRGAGRALALVRFSGALTDENPTVTERKVQALRDRLSQLKAQRLTAIVPAADDSDPRPEPVSDQAAEPQGGMPGERLRTLILGGVQRAYAQNFDLREVMRSVLARFQSSNEFNREKVRDELLARFSFRNFSPSERAGLARIRSAIHKAYENRANPEVGFLEGLTGLPLEELRRNPFKRHNRAAFIEALLEIASFIPIVGAGAEAGLAGIAFNRLKDALERDDLEAADNHAFEVAEHLAGIVLSVGGPVGKGAGIVAKGTKATKKLLKKRLDPIAERIKKVAADQRFRGLRKNVLRNDPEFLAGLERMKVARRQRDEVLSRFRRETEIHKTAMEGIKDSAERKARERAFKPRRDAMKAQRIQINNAYGKQFEEFVVLLYRKRGFEIVREQERIPLRKMPASLRRLRRRAVPLRTARIYDFVIRDPRTGKVRRIEVKSGEAGRHPIQKHNDRVAKLNKKEEGERLKVTTITEKQVRRILGDEFQF